MSFPRSNISASSTINKTQTQDSTAKERFEDVDQYIEDINEQVNQFNYISADQIEFIGKQVVELIKLKVAAIKQKEVCDLVDADKDSNELLLRAYNQLKLLITKKISDIELSLQMLKEVNSRLDQRPYVGFVNENNNNASTFRLAETETQSLNLPKSILFNDVEFKFAARRGVFFAHIIQDSLDAKKIWKYPEHNKMFTKNKNFIELSVKNFLDYNSRTFGLENMVSLDERGQPFLYSDNPVLNPSLPKQIKFLKKTFSLSADGKYYYICSLDLNDASHLFHAVNKLLDSLLKKRKHLDSNLKLSRNFGSPFITFPVASYKAAQSAGEDWFTPVETPFTMSEAGSIDRTLSSGTTVASKDSRKKNTVPSGSRNVQKSLDDASDVSANVTQFQEGDVESLDLFSTSASSTTSIFRGFVGDNPGGTFLQDLQTTPSQFSESVPDDFESEMPMAEYGADVAQFQEGDSAGNSLPTSSTASSTGVLDNYLGDLENSFMQTFAASSQFGEISDPFDLNVPLLDTNIDIDRFNVAPSDASHDDLSDFVDSAQLSPQVLFCQTTDKGNTQPQPENDFETLKKRRLHK